MTSPARDGRRRAWRVRDAQGVRPSGRSTDTLPVVPRETVAGAWPGAGAPESVRSGHSLGNLIHAKHPDLTGPGLQSSIIETVSATFEDGIVKSANVAGELAFVHNDADISAEKSTLPFHLSISFPQRELTRCST